MLKKLRTWLLEDEEEWNRNSSTRFASAPFIALIAGTWLALQASVSGLAFHFIAAGSVVGMVWGLLLSLYWKTRNFLWGCFLLICILVGLQKAPAWLLNIKIDSILWTEFSEYIASCLLVAMTLAYLLRPQELRPNQARNSDATK